MPQNITPANTPQVYATWITACTTDPSVTAKKAVTTYRADGKVLYRVDEFTTGINNPCFSVLVPVNRDDVISLLLVTGGVELKDIAVGQ